jgi:uncharacterized protein YxjI
MDKPEPQQQPGENQPSGGKRFHIRQEMLSIGNDYSIENEQGEQVYKVDGKAMRLHKTFDFEDARGTRLAVIEKRMVAIKETMEIKADNGEQLAVVKKAMLKLLRDHFAVSVKNGPDLEIQGNILDHEYGIGEGQNKVAEVSKKFFHLRDSYSVLIQPGQDEVIILAVVVCIDEMTHAGN